VTTIDWIALGFALFTALIGLRKGLVGTAFSLAGLVVGSLVGARLAPHFLHGGATSPYTPLVALGGAVAGALVGQMLAGFAAGFIRGGLRLVPPLRTLDTLGGLVLGAAWGLALVWAVSAVALQLPKHSQVRAQVDDSQVVRQLDKLAPPRDVLRLKAKVGSLPDLPAI
jgi:uncharacterized membrane protein required for colicin V production